MQPLNARQLAYCHHRAVGKAPAQAALEAGYLSPAMQATRMERMISVREEIATIRKAIPPKPQAGPLSREDATGILADIARCTSAHHNSRVMALKLLADLEGWVDARGPTVGLVIQLGQVEKSL